MISLPVSELSSDIYIRRIRIDGNLVSDIRSYSTAELFESNSDLGYKITLNTTSWDWCCDKTVNTHEIESFNLKEYCSTNNSGNLNKALSNTCFIALDFVCGSNFDTANYPYGRYNYEILNDSSKMNFNLQ